MAIIERKRIRGERPRYIVSYNKANLNDSEFICDTAEEAARIANKLTYDFFFERIVLNGTIQDGKISFDLDGDEVKWIEDYLTFFSKETVEDITMDEDGGGNELIYIKKVNY
jgi:hypothetical protein